MAEKTAAERVALARHPQRPNITDYIDGLFTADPQRDPSAKLIPVVEAITPEMEAAAQGAGSALGTGGMSTKLRAARMVTASGADMVIANGSHPELLYPIVEGKPVGTRFLGIKEADK